MKHSTKKTSICVLVTMTLICGCAPQSADERDFGTYSDDRNVNGAILIYGAGKDEFIGFCGPRCQERFIPASTFKILNALIALETGVIQDENQVITWDGVD